MWVGHGRRLDVERPVAGSLAQVAHVVGAHDALAGRAIVGDHLAVEQRAIPAQGPLLRTPKRVAAADPDRDARRCTGRGKKATSPIRKCLPLKENGSPRHSPSMMVSASSSISARVSAVGLLTEVGEAGVGEHVIVHVADAHAQHEPPIG